MNEKNAANDPKTVTVTIPTAGSFFGLGVVIEWLLVFGSWMVLGMMYLCVPGSIAGAALVLATLVANVGSGAAAIAVCLGCAVACVGLCLPLLRAAQLVRVWLLNGTRALLGKEKSSAAAPDVKNPALLKVSLVLLAVGVVVWGAGALMGGMAAVELPGLVTGMFA